MQLPTRLFFIDQNTQIEQHADVQEEDTNFLVYDWQNKIFIPDNCGKYRLRLVDMLYKILLIKYGCLVVVFRLKRQIRILYRQQSWYTRRSFGAGTKTHLLLGTKIKKVLNNNTIETAQYGNALTKVFVSKKEHISRLCNGHFKRSTAVKSELYPILSTNKGITFPNDSTIVFVLDASSEWWKIQADNADCNKTIFPVFYRSCQFFHVPFKLWHSPSPLRPTLDVVFITVKWKFTLIYLGKIVVF